MSKTIIVLSDGETWDTSGYVITLTDDAFGRLLEGSVKPHQLRKADHIMELPLYPKETK